MKREQMKSCLVINGDQPFNIREKRALQKHFKEVDFVHNLRLDDLFPTKDYDPIIVNWALKSLSESDAKYLLFVLRKSLTLKRKNKKENGVIIVKEPVQQLDP